MPAIREMARPIARHVDKPSRCRTLCVSLEVREFHESNVILNTRAFFELFLNSLGKVANRASWPFAVYINQHVR